MTLLTKLSKTTIRTKKRVGRGAGSGKGMHTSGRGQKGQKTRGTMPLWFEGGQLPLIRRTPFIRGKSRFDALTPKAIAIRVGALEAFKAGDIVDKDAVIKVLKLRSSKVAKFGVKILSGGELTKSLTVKLPASTKAVEAIKAAGGEVQL